MSERQQYRVITFGQLAPNVVLSDVIQGVILEFSLSPSKASALCQPSHKARTLSSGLSIGQAQHLHLILTKLGLIARVIPDSSRASAKAEVVFTFDNASEGQSSSLKSPQATPQNRPASKTPAISNKPLASDKTSSPQKPSFSQQPSTASQPSNPASRTSLPTPPSETPSWQTMDSLREIPLKFMGNAGEFTNLWHRHWFLSLLSLGLFLPWAQVRQQRYLWSQLSVDGVAFDYHGNPWGLLWSQLAIVLGGTLFLGGFVSAVWFPVIATPVSIAFQVMALLLIVLASRFRFFYHWRHLSLGGERIQWFGFQGYAYFYVLLAPLLSLVTLGVLTPYSVYAIHSDQINRICIGRTFAQFDGVLGDYFDCGFRTLAWVVAIYLGITGLLAAIDWQYWWGGLLVGLIVLWVVVQYLRQQYFMLALKSTDVDGVGFDVSNRLFSMASHTGELIVMVFTLGLATPWVRYRRWQQYCDHLRFLYAGSLIDWVKTAKAKKR